MALIFVVSSHASSSLGASPATNGSHHRRRFAGLLQLFDVSYELHVSDQFFPVRLGGAYALEAVAIRVVVVGAVGLPDRVDDRHLDGATVEAPCALGVHRPDGPVRELMLVGVVPRVTSTAAHSHGIGASLELSEVLAELGLYDVESATEAALNTCQLLVLGLVDHTIDLEVDDAVAQCRQLCSILKVLEVAFLVAPLWGMLCIIAFIILFVKYL